MHLAERGLRRCVRSTRPGDPGAHRRHRVQRGERLRRAGGGEHAVRQPRAGQVGGDRAADPSGQRVVHRGVDGEQLGVHDGGEHQLVGPARDGAQRGEPDRGDREQAQLGVERVLGGLRHHGGGGDRDGGLVARHRDPDGRNPRPERRQRLRGRRRRGVNRTVCATAAPLGRESAFPTRRVAIRHGGRGCSARADVSGLRAPQRRSRGRQAGRANRPSGSCSVRPSCSSENRQRSRWAASAHTASRAARSTGASAARRTSRRRPRTWRSVPAYVWTALRGPVYSGWPGGPPRAQVADRAHAAPGRPRRADDRAQLHQPRRDHRRAGVGGGQERVDVGEVGRHPRGPGVARAVDRPRDHPPDVRVDHRAPPPVPERRDRPRGVGADARQRLKRVHIGRHDAAVRVADRLGRGVQAQRPARVAELAPRPQDLGPARGGQRGGRRPGRHPRRPDGLDARHRRLLEHELADHDAPRRRARAAPREVAGLREEPVVDDVGQRHDRGSCQTTSFSFPVATSNTKPRIESFFGTNGLALMRAIDWRTSVSRSPNASVAHGGLDAGLLLDRGLEAVVGEGEHAAVGVVDEDDLRRAEQPLADGQRADLVLGDHAARVADDVRVALVQAEDRRRR